MPVSLCPLCPSVHEQDVGSLPAACLWLTSDLLDRKLHERWRLWSVSGRRFESTEDALGQQLWGLQSGHGERLPTLLTLQTDTFLSVSHQVIDNSPSVINSRQTEAEVAGDRTKTKQRMERLFRTLRTWIPVPSVLLFSRTSGISSMFSMFHNLTVPSYRDTGDPQLWRPSFSPAPESSTCINNRRIPDSLILLQ